MIVRHFTAPDRTTWRVWAVRPAVVLGDRRHADDRRVLADDDEAADPPILERRRGADRRQVGAAAGHRRGTRVLPQQFHEGWLVFEADRSTDVRRLAPIPGDWEECPEAALGEYLARAHGSERRAA